MTDIVSAQKRSMMMAGIKSKNTKPEIIVRKALFARGFRFRLHNRTLPGKPDLYFPKYRTAIFVNGCFWHGHDCKHFRTPKSNTDFWLTKIRSNQIRDQRVLEELRQVGIRTLTVWECETKFRNDELYSYFDSLEIIIKNIKIKS